ncbi:hypothetical protein; putative signal peptide [Bradyrhizobium sp. ORS 278]|uniref:hypothetical protein n=1 Tax=Bradyrhizobium sp. (strain ORS 278) TaxID=114615 RepID=UPI0001508F2F|nr:hypothetical protein [Bradyrhizobium sp. ORS 278]CAL77071.1 hypothetical protein; putative signal peptide [Bradyrhizobium sp. ORS 278]
MRDSGVVAAARALPSAAALLATLLLAGCATSSTPAPEAGASFNNTYNYLPVNDLPHDEQRPVLSVEQQEKLRKELMAVRDRQVPAAAKGAAAKPAASPDSK